jgi:diadenosine tetraphosphate (Ap4A) HIT family hydrolase
MKFYSRKKWDIEQPKDLWANICIFCERKSWGTKEYIIWEWKHWFISHNKFPVLGLKNQLIAIPKRHVKMAHELNNKEMQEYPTVEKFIYDFYKWWEYFTFMRESIQNRSLEHIHYHFLPWKLNYKHLEYILLEQWFTQKGIEE